MRQFILSTFFICLATLLLAQSKVINAIKDNEELVATGYFFYPSTLRMVNLDRDPEFDKLVKPIKKLSFISLRQDQFDQAKLRSIADELIEKEDCETYADMDGPDMTLYALGHDVREYTCVLAYLEDEYYIAEISGKIDLMQIVKVVEKIQTRDTTDQTGFLNIFDLMTANNEEQRKREAQRKKWEEDNAKKEAAEKMKKDSLEAIEQKKSTVIQE